MTCRFSRPGGCPLLRRLADAICGCRLDCTLTVVVLAIQTGVVSAQPPCQTALEEPEFAFAAGCLIRHGDRMLAVRHRFGGKLGFPAGRTNSGESAQCVAHRETWEETGLEVVVHDMLKRFGNGFALYRCELADNEAAEADELEVPASGRNEITQVIWIDPRSTRAADWRFPRDYPEILRLFED